MSALNSFVVDYCCRQGIGGTNLHVYILEQIPVPPAAMFREPRQWSAPESLDAWLLPRVLELTYTAWDLEPFARDVGYDGPPFRWDPERRFLLRCELDAAFFHLYGISRDDTDYVMDTFPIVRKNDEKAHGEYRTKRVILEIYDEMAEAARTGKPYQTRLDPPPADPRVAPPRRSPKAPLGTASYRDRHAATVQMTPCFAALGCRIAAREGGRRQRLRPGVSARRRLARLREHPVPAAHLATAPGRGRLRRRVLAAERRPRSSSDTARR